MAQATPDGYYKSTLNIANQRTDPQRFSGQAFGFDGTVLGTFYPKTDADVVRTSIEMILMTSPGERVMRPSFGSKLTYLLFEQNDIVLQIALRAAVEETVSRWEDRVLVGPVEVVVNENTVTIRVPLALVTPRGAEDINCEISLDRETLYSYLPN